MSKHTSLDYTVLTMNIVRLLMQSTCKCVHFITKTVVEWERSINHAETTVVFASSDHVQFLLKLAPSVPKLKVVVILDEIPVESKDILVAWGKDRNVQVLGLRDCMYMTSNTIIRLRINLLPTQWKRWAQPISWSLSGRGRTSLPRSAILR